MKPEDVSRKHHRTKEQIQREHKWLKPIAEELKAEFGGYSKLKIMEDGEVVYSWEKKSEAFVEPTNLLEEDRKRKPTYWRTDK
jgi:hypothetical protein